MIFQLFLSLHSMDTGQGLLGSNPTSESQRIANPPYPCGENRTATPSRYMMELSIDPEEQTARVGAGVRWRDASIPPPRTG
jgi:hypothetical protein